MQAGQTGSVTTYDHNNGLRVLDSSRINSKLFIVGVLILPVKSPKAILTTKDLITVAGAVDTAVYQKKQLKVVKGILKPPKKNKGQMSSQESRIKGNKRTSHPNGEKRPRQVNLYVARVTVNLLLSMPLTLMDYL